MTQASLQQSIEDKKGNLTGLIILTYSDNDWLARQYASAIVDANKFDCVYCNIEDINVSSCDIFGESDTNTEYIVSTNSFDSDDVRLLSKNIIVIANKVSKEAKEKFSANIVDMPKLDEWSIKDYIFSITGAEESTIENMYSLCSGDIHRIDNEISKLKVFDESYRKILLENMLTDKSLGDVSKYSILNLSNAIIKRDIGLVTSIMSEIECIDVNVFALITLLYNGFKNVVAIQLSRNPTPESTGIKSGQFYAIKKNNIGYYNKDALYSILGFLSGIDKEIKSGKLPIEISIDYIVYNILSM